MSASIAAVIAVSILGFFISLKDHKFALAAAVFLLPWFGLEAEIGLRVTAYQLVVCALALRMLLIRSASTTRYGLAGIVAFAAYMLIRSIVQIPFLPEAEIEGGIFRGPGLRPIAQCLYFLTTLLPILIMARISMNREDVLRLGAVYVVSCVLLAGLGWLQLVIWYSTGTNPLPIGITLQLFDPTARVNSGYVVLGGEELYRMNSFGGEPKDLGRSLVAGVIVLMAGALGNIVRIRTVIVVGGFLIASILMTMSTSAFALLAIGGIVMLMVPRLAGRITGGAGSALIYVSVMIFVGLGSAAYLLSTLVGPGGTDDATITDLIVARTTERGQILEDFDEAVVEYLGKNPMAALLGVGMGNVHLYAEQYLAPEVAEYASGTPFTGKHGIVRVIADGGIVGFGLLVFAIYQLVNTAGRVAEFRTEVAMQDLNAIWVTTALAVALFFLYLGNNGLAPHLYVTIGLLSRLVGDVIASIWRTRRVSDQNRGSSGVVRSS